MARLRRGADPAHERSGPEPDPAYAPGFAQVRGFALRRLVRLISLRLAPAVAAGLITYGSQGVPLEGMIAFVAMLVVSGLLRWSDFPVHLMPMATLSQYLLVPPLGMALTLLVGAADGNSATYMTPADAIAPALAAATVMIAGAALWRSFSAGAEVTVGVIGSTAFARVLETELEAVGVRGYRVEGTIALNGERADPTSNILGRLTELREIVTRHGIDLLVLGPLATRGEDPDESRFQTAGPGRLEVFERVAESCLDLPVSMIDSPQFYEEVFGHVPLGTTNSAWFAYLMHPRYRAGSPVYKRALDLIVGSVAGLLFLPVLAISAVAIKLTGPGPVFHRQRRIGEGGREIEVVKLRTMAVARHGSPQRWAAPDDERITGVGRWLRRFHIDELPQLWLVLKGEMSLVGPRPEQPGIVGELEGSFSYYDRRHLVKPGITGWAQVRCGYAGSHLGTAWKLCHDLYYLKRRSLLFDLLIMVETLARIGVPEPVGRPDQRLIVAIPADQRVPVA